MRRRKSAPLELEPIVAELWEDVEITKVAQPIMVTMQKEMRRTLLSCSLNLQVSLVVFLYAILMLSYRFYWWVICADICFMFSLGLLVKSKALEQTLSLWTGVFSYVESPDGYLFLIPARGQGTLRTFDSTPYLMIFMVSLVVMLGLILMGDKSDIYFQLAGGFFCLISFAANLYVLLMREYIRLWYKYLIPVWKATRVSLLLEERF